MELTGQNDIKEAQPNLDTKLAGTASNRTFTQTAVPRPRITDAPSA